MPGRPSRSKPVRYVGALAALVAVVGYVALGRRFDDGGGTVPVAFGVVLAVVAVGWTAYRLSSPERD